MVARDDAERSRLARSLAFLPFSPGSQRPVLGRRRRRHGAAVVGLDDLEAASVLGTSASLHVAFGLIGAVLTDAIGVRRVALTALSISVVGRGLLAFGRSRTSIYAAFYLFSPAGEALLATGLYRVALKKLTTPKTRAFAFAVEYATFNLSGALADVCIDAFRRRGDVTLGIKSSHLFCGLRVGCSSRSTSATRPSSRPTTAAPWRRRHRRRPGPHENGAPGRPESRGRGHSPRVHAGSRPSAK